ncbi:hypothetical protein RJ639_010396 [Escallonia herrerae]|nr:hypothetical protein RJ639_010396 [Escallonia herrerae]
MKHIALDYHFVRECVTNGSLRVHHISTKDQLVDILTKALGHPQFLNLRSKIGVTNGASILRGRVNDSCGIFAFITGVGRHNYTSGCAALCGKNFNFLFLADTCSGLGCCETYVPREITSFDMRILSITISNSSITTAYSTAFLAHKEYSVYELKTSDNTKIFPAPVVLNWVIGNVTCHKARERRNYACSQNSNCFDSNGQGYQCLCSQGYQG